MTISYDSVGTVSESNAFGDTTDYFYDHHGQLVAVRDPLSNMTFLSYDNDYQPKKVTDAVGQVTTFDYDATEI